VKFERLPETGVFYVRGGYGNIEGYKPQSPNHCLAAVFSGDDDRPGYSDSQISEALLAKENQHDRAQKLLGRTRDLGAPLGLESDWAANMIQTTGNSHAHLVSALNIPFRRD
jgi:hypothetical protein